MDLTWTLHGCELNGQPFWPQIYDGQLNEEVPEGFNVVRIPLDAQTKSDLNWEKEGDWAQSLVDQGLFLWWDLDLGLFDRLKQPFSDQAQLATLLFSIHHFSETLWRRFQKGTMGVNLYRGPVPCEDVEYLDLLGSEFPGDAAVFVTLDATKIEGALQRALLTSTEIFQHLHPIVAGGHPGQEAMAWREGGSRYGFLGRDLSLSSKADLPSLGLCLPPLATYQPQWEGVMKEMEAQGEPYRLIPEGSLTTKWDELDTLVTIDEGVTPLGRRKILGFQAAGGNVLQNCQKTIPLR